MLLRKYVAQVICVGLKVFGAGANSPESVGLRVRDARLAVTRVATIEVKVLLPVCRLFVNGTSQGPVFYFYVDVEKIDFSS